MRLRHDASANRLHWEVSADQSIWTSLYDITTPVTVALAAVRIELLGGTYTSSADPGIIKLDNFTLAAPDLLDLNTFTDDFESAAVDVTKWNLGTSVLTGSDPLQDVTVGAVQTNGRFTITPLGNVSKFHYNGLQSVNRYDLTNREVSLEIVQPPIASSSGTEFFLFLTHNSSSYYAINVHDGALWAYAYVGGSMEYVQILPIVPRFIRMRNVFNHILWEASTDTEGKYWQVLRQQQTAFPLTSLRVELAGGTYKSVLSPTPIIIDNLNLPGLAAPARLSVVTSTTAATPITNLSSYPNPTTGNTNICYQLPASARVSLAIYNALGAKMATLANEQQAAGTHNLQLDCTRFPSGVYFLRLATPQYKMHHSFVVSK